MSYYLQEAAKLLRRVSDYNEKANKDNPEVLNAKREQLAAAFAELAAIERGLRPTDMLFEIMQRTTPDT
ncbi:hypothetical protein [Actinomadura kijaniata]|uniref:hypothetical protein n=1 Tax=Actinomadura kijaniata TaxID=46161 RepID=UPI000832A11E|nr:hypothetical protein [Actinomadura kijaniata]